VEADLIEKRETFNIVEFRWPGNLSFGEILDHAGKIPIPPYLNRDSEESDKQTYQTIFGKIDGSVAAPTAGLHFTEKVMQSLKQRNIVASEVTLHVGAGTFKPVSSDSIKEHTMHSEFFTVSKSTLENLIKNLGNITAVGTTTVRTLESLYFIGNQIVNGVCPANHHFTVAQWEPYEDKTNLTTQRSLEAIVDYLKINLLEYLTATTSIMIIPGYQHKIVNRLVTNFHQPRSTLLLLLASFVGNDWKKMYDFALDNNFRFLSYGDSCLIVNRIV
jgi:S-adenosylmethionine:tRNA ribosyltransferase-isomerase